MNRLLKIKNIIPILYCALMAFLTLMICSRSSFLYVYNMWDDANSYFTMGKSMLFGKVPYRDLFDQKGALLYTIYMLAYLMSHTTFHGVFVMEVIAGTASLLAAYCILRLYVKSNTAFILIPIIATFMYSPRAFWWGGSAEEFLLPFLMWGLFIMLRKNSGEYDKNHGQAFLQSRINDASWSRREMLSIGLLAGCVFHIKFNSLGFYIAFMMIVAIRELRYLRIKECLENILFFLLGFIIISAPFIIYFGINGALDDYMYVYIYLNIFVYSKSLPFAERIYQMCKVIYNLALLNKGLAIPILVGIIGWFYLIFRKKSLLLTLIHIVLMAGLLLTFIFIGGVELQYYPYPVAAFVVLGGVVIGVAAEDFLGVISSKRYRIRKSNQYFKYEGNSAELTGSNFAEKTNRRTADNIEFLTITASILSVLAGILIVYSSSMNVRDMGVTSNDLWLYEFRDYIMQSSDEEPTLLNMNCFDAGLYTVTGIVPDCYYFQTQTLRYEDVIETQKTYIREEKPDFILSRDAILDFTADEYYLALSAKMEMENYNHTYFLYERTD